VMISGELRSVQLYQKYSSIVSDRFQDFLKTSDNQFWFKKALGCSHAIFSVRKIIERFIKAGYTANLCSIDLSKAFDNVNHNCLFLKLMNRRLTILKFW